MTILEKIIAHKRNELTESKKKIPAGLLEKMDLFEREIISLSAFLTNSEKTGIIAEFKRRSPSKGIINSEALVNEITAGYFREGASGVSILTDYKFFGGRNKDISDVRVISPFPILRKEFIIDEYQVVESKAIGADAILLIAAALTAKETMNLAKLARSLGMEVLLEVHEDGELDHVNEYVNIIGVNNRNLKSFDVSIEISLSIAEKIPSGFIKISESGISSPQVIKELRSSGYNGFLIGERFMAASDPVKAFSGFVKELISIYDKN